MLYGTPDNTVLGCVYRRENGILQVRLFYPINGGSANAQGRAELLKDHFPRGLTVSFGGTNVLINRTPEKRTLGVEGDRYVVAVSIFYQAEIFA